MYKNLYRSGKLNMSAARLNNSTTVQNKKDVSLGRENQSEKP